MNQRILYVGLDVDDTHYHGSALSQETGEVLQFQCRPTLKGLVGQLAKLRKHCAGHTIEVAYEASYIGFTLQRDLASQGYHCDVVAPSRIPRVGGKAITTDRIDAAQLAQFYANGLLTRIELGQLSRIDAIGFDRFTSHPRTPGRGHHITMIPLADEIALEGIADVGGFIGDLDGVTGKVLAQFRELTHQPFQGRSTLKMQNFTGCLRQR